jgi:hypothetical protein
MRWLWTMTAVLMLAGPAMAYVTQLDSAAGAIDTAPPTAGFTLSDPTPTSENPVHFSVDFNEPVGTTFDENDVSLTGTLALAATVNVSGTDPNYIVTVTKINPADDGTVGIQIGAAVTDLMGNACVSGSSLMYTLVSSLQHVPVAGLAGIATLLGLVTIGGVWKRRRQ